MAILNLPFSLMSLVSILSLLSTQIAAHNKAGFTTNLIHRDSPSSPTYNPFLSKWDRIRGSLHRSAYRISLYRPLAGPDDFQSQVVPARGEYVMEVSLGTPPVRQFAIADTGSDLIWFQCQPCLSCYRQKPPIFDPSKSTSYQLESCKSQSCQELSDKSSCSQKSTCLYTYAYGDESHTKGDLANETLTFGANKGDTIASYPEVTFGCGHDNQGTFRDDGSGLIGLGGGPLSLVSQLKSSVGGKFSYCLIPFFQEGNVSSKISFGEAGQVSGAGVLSTPLIKGAPDTFYYLTLEGMSVGEDKNRSFVPFKRASTNDYETREEGNIIIDSGTTLTMLPLEMYTDLTNALTETIKGKKVEDPSGALGLCYESSSGGGGLNIPTITAHFTGANVDLKPVNTFIEVADDVVCLAMLAADQVAIYGNVAQSNFVVGYDLEEGKVLFKPADCSKD